MVPRASGTYSSSAAFSILPPLPDGLTIDSVTGEIKGKPVIASEMQEYEVTLVVESGSGESDSGCKLSTRYRFHLEVSGDDVIDCDGSTYQCQV